MILKDAGHIPRWGDAMQFVWIDWQDLVAERLGEVAVLRRKVSDSTRFWAHLECRCGCHWICTRAVKPDNAVAVSLSEVPEAHRPSRKEIFNAVGAKVLYAVGGSKFLLELSAPGRLCYMMLEFKPGR